MDRYLAQLEICKQIIDRIRHMISMQHIQSNNISCTELYNELYKLIPLVPVEYKVFSDRLRDKILPNLKMPDFIYVNQFGQPLSTPQNGINPYLFGEVIATIAYLNGYSNNNSSSIWDNIHPQIASVAKERFDVGHYADAVEAAFKEINVRVKTIYKERALEEKDGARLMQSAFSPNNPIIKIGDISTETGRDIQQGYMEMFSGAMKGIRNPKAHNNQTISKADAIRKLHFASMLMHKLDNELA